MSKQAACQVIENAQNIVLATHVRPDGDALGSLLGLANILKMMGKQVICYLEEPIAELYSFLHSDVRIEMNMDTINAYAEQYRDDIMGICLDCGDLSRLGEHGKELSNIQPFLVIDHHQGNNGFGDVEWIESHRSSTGEMVYDLAVELGVGEKISPEAAECLYTAIVTDTGSFQYDATSSHTLAVAAQLLERGVKPAFITQKLYDNSSFGRLQLMQLVLATLHTYCGDQVAIIRVTLKMLKTTGTDYEDCEGFINFPRSVKTVRVAVLLKEREDEEVTISMRAKGDCDVALVAREFGGGGHRNAAGLRMVGHTMEQVHDLLLPVLEQALLGTPQN
ncbi:MAG: bifunctional oligoribonuclease/PAP phosphatase NrnA [Candidatus Electrothrix sp. AR3]|nr:bifunctional oligoribonuclease/PAP phosphatase NrnA [Candidatus Electrothrix sp. AR3]